MRYFFVDFWSSVNCCRAAVSLSFHWAVMRVGEAKAADKAAEKVAVTAREAITRWMVSWGF